MAERVRIGIMGCGPRGIHVPGEIPVADSIEEGEYLYKKVNESKALYMCGSNPNYRSKVLLTKRFQEMGLLGKIAYIETEYAHGTGEKVKEILLAHHLRIHPLLHSFSGADPGSYRGGVYGSQLYEHL